MKILGKLDCPFCQTSECCDGTIVVAYRHMQVVNGRIVLTEAEPQPWHYEDDPPEPDHILSQAPSTE